MEWICIIGTQLEKVERVYEALEYFPNLVESGSFGQIQFGKGSRIAFWLGTWENATPFNIQFLRLFIIALLPKGSIAEHWDSQLNSWAINFCRLLKEEEIAELNLIGKSSARRISEDFDKRVWFLGTSGRFSVKSFTTHLSPSSPLNKVFKQDCRDSVRQLLGDRYEVAHGHASSWCILSKDFDSYYISDFNLNWSPFDPKLNHELV
ncbi:retrotransposon protein, putative, unclassified [Cucumis melo var. makuwa]|uniref:Retrotransposon protein, putative, unclassified n=1 Tax=Cucumis melo var. makuwa TaxID=1194695 RepID=A0A5A7UP04_CUCMM|nr:retrotransposon protein, putative, unclassified [Cucumis melo var. makuwa]TYK03179.1 retrotransposon protein, putative, unclassified [Cucumis melo var. makuwa]